ncbi:MAG: hypothetical protein IPN73_01080 [Saprospiraceae bacterium]|nr:hypothetical protein [Saprospiraceae bacterium]
MNLKFMVRSNFIITIVVMASLFVSCSDPCKGIECDYDGQCETGECVCTELTENYLYGSWRFSTQSSTAGTFKEDKTFIDSFGNIVNWQLDAATKTISISTGNKIIVRDIGFNCEQMEITIKSGSTQTDYTFIRQ